MMVIDRFVTKQLLFDLIKEEMSLRVPLKRILAITNAVRDDGDDDGNIVAACT